MRKPRAMTDPPEAPSVAPEPIPLPPAPAKPEVGDWRDTLSFLLKLAIVVFIFRSFSSRRSHPVANRCCRGC